MHSIESRILVVDDDPTVAEVVTGYLERAGHTVDLAMDGPAALGAAARCRPDLVVLDLMLPGMDGLEVCRRLRADAAVPVPVIMLTARGDEDDRILGLEIGADDYVTKPFSPRELVLRVESVLRRARTASARPGPRMSRSGITLDPAARTASKAGAELALTLREFDLLAYLLARPGEAISRERLMHEVWGWEFGDLSTVTVHVRRLRGKIETDPAKPALIRTVWGVGYRFEAEPDAPLPETRPQAPSAVADPPTVSDPAAVSDALAMSAQAERQAAAAKMVEIGRWADEAGGERGSEVPGPGSRESALDRDSAEASIRSVGPDREAGAEAAGPADRVCAPGLPGATGLASAAGLGGGAAAGPKAAVIALESALTEGADRG